MTDDVDKLLDMAGRFRAPNGMSDDLLVWVLAFYDGRWRVRAANDEARVYMNDGGDPSFHMADDLDRGQLYWKFGRLSSDGSLRVGQSTQQLTLRQAEKHGLVSDDA